MKRGLQHDVERITLPKGPMEPSWKSSIHETSLLVLQHDAARDAEHEPLVPAFFVGAVKNKATPAPKRRSVEGKFANVR